MMKAQFKTIEQRQPDNHTFRQLILTGRLMAQNCRDGQQNKLLAATWDELLERWQDEQTLKKPMC